MAEIFQFSDVATTEVDGQLAVNFTHTIEDGTVLHEVLTYEPERPIRFANVIRLLRAKTYSSREEVNEAIEYAELMSTHLK
ncbi:MAG: hypothetical protein ABI076_05630 [Acidobacteriaceae bacterium]